MSLNTNVQLLNVEQLKFYKDTLCKQLVLNSHRTQYASKLMRKIEDVEKREKQLKQEATDVR